MPGESISKYSGRNQQPERQAISSQPEVAPHAEDWRDEPPTIFDLAEREGESDASSTQPEQHNASERGHIATEPEQLEWAAAGSHHQSESEEQESVPPPKVEATVAAPAVVEESHAEDHDDSETVFEVAERRDFDDDEVEESSQSVVEDAMVEPHRHFASELSAPDNGSSDDVANGAGFEAEQTVAHLHPDESPANDHSLPFPGHGAAPDSAPQGRTLEHETLEDEEMEFHPVPEDLEALNEAAADSDLDLIQETLDADNGYSERWLPKIADVDEEEVLAAEMRGETYQVAGDDENGDDEEDEDANGRAELRAASPTMAYQQRQQNERPGYERRGQRGRRSNNRRNNVRPRPHSNRSQPLITDLLKEGQEILVQIAKEPLGKKGARITSHIALARPLPGLHAHREPRRRLAQDHLRGGAPAAEAHHYQRARERPGRIHRPHRRCQHQGR